MSAVRIAAIAMLTLAGTALSAQTPSAAPKATAQGASPQLAAALAKFKQGDLVGKQIFGQLRATQAQIQLEAQRPITNLDLFNSLIRKADGLSAQFRSHQSDLLLQALKGLPEADRPTFLKTIGLAGKPAAAPAAPAPTN